MRLLKAALNHNAESETQFIFDQLPNGSTGPESNPEDLTPEEEREAALADTSLALDELRAELETNDLSPEDLPLGEQILFLVRIARNDAHIDTAEDDRSRAERWRDNLGRIADGYISSDRALTWQYNSDFSDAAYILSLITNEAKLRFLTDYSDDARALFTDHTGQNNGGMSYRADFYGDQYLSRQANFMNLLSAEEPGHSFLQMGNEFYARTPQGYIGFHPEGVVGNRAQVVSGTEFTVYDPERLPEQEPNLNEVLASVREQNNLFDQIDSPEEMRRLEANREVNFHTAQTWKGFADRMLTANLPEELVLTQTLRTLFSKGGSFRQFLDGDSTLGNYSTDAAVSFSIPGFSETAPGLSSTAEPTQFRDGILAALRVVENYSRAEVDAYKAALESETNLEIKAAMQRHLQSLVLAVPELFNEIDTYTDQELGAIDEMRRANLLLLQEYLPEDISQAELEAWINEFDESFYEIISNPEGYDEAAYEAALGLLVARMLGVTSQEGQLLLEQNPELKAVIQARISTLRRRPGVQDMDGALEIARQQFYIRNTLETLASINPSLVSGIDIENPTTENLNQLILSCQALQEGFRHRLNNDDTLSDEEQALYDYLQSAVPHLTRASQALTLAAQRRGQAQYSEVNAMAAEDDTSILFDPNSERGQNFHQAVNTYSQAIREFRVSNNGAMPPTTTADFAEVSQRLANGESPTEVVTSLQTAFVQGTPLGDIPSTSSPVRVEAPLLRSTPLIPPGATIVGLTDSGQYILETPAFQDMIFLQDPFDGTIIAEHLTGVPDAEDLRVPPEEWATAQALGAMTEGFVLKTAAELAQDAETLGNMALVNFMRQYWGLRGNDTLPESELDKFKSLGEMMSEHRINFQIVLRQLNALKWDETAAGNRAVDVRIRFNEILEAAAAGNHEGFRRLLNLDALPEEDFEA